MITKPFQPALTCLALAMIVTAPVDAVEPKVITPSSTPERHGGHTYIPARLAGTLFRAESRWNKSEPTVEIAKPGHVVRFRVGSRTAMVNGRRVQLAVAPYRKDGETMVPFRLVGQAMGAPVGYEARSESLSVGPGEDGVRWLVPLETPREGIVVHSPAPGAESDLEVRVHLQANVREGDLVVQLQDADGKVLQESKTPGLPRPMGVYREHIVFLLNGRANGPTRELQVVAFSPHRKTGEQRFKVSVPVKLHRSL